MTAKMTDEARTLCQRVLLAYGVHWRDIVAHKGYTHHVMRARWAVAWALRQHRWTHQRIAKALGRGESSIYGFIAEHDHLVRMGLAPAIKAGNLEHGHLVQRTAP